MTDIVVSDEQQLYASLIGNLGKSISHSVPETGIAMMRRAIGCNPRDAAHYLGLASALIIQGEQDEPKAIVEAILAREDKITQAWQMLGVLATHRGDLEEAIRCHKRAHEISPTHGQARFDLAAAYLRAGRWEEGWPLYAHRHEILPSTGPLPDAPLWVGEKTGHLAVWGDQGHGDRFQFARFLPWARERADKITFLTNAETIPILYGYKPLIGGDVTCLYDPAKLKFDHHICLSDLPMLYGCTPENIPPDPGLLSPAATTDRLGAAGLKIGIAWAGNRDHPNDNIRSMRLAELLPLASDPRNSIFSLQCGPPAGDIAKMRAQRVITDMSGMIEGEFAHTAAVIKNLDLVVTVDTAIAHLAGCLRVPCFLLIARLCDWRWLWDREDSPWYPNMRIFRQDKPGDWKGVVDGVMAALRDLHHQRAVVRMTNERIVLQFDPHRPGTADQKEPDVAAVLRKVLRPGDTFVDVGANVGMHTALAAELVGEHGKVIAIEPGENALPELRKAVDGKPQVEIVDRPLAAASGPVEFHLCADGSGGNALWDPGEFPTNDKTRANPRKVTLQATTLSAVCLGHSVCLIKIDTEGAEQRVLEGGVEMLVGDQPPFIVTELHEFGLAKLGHSQESLRQFMEKVGYRMFALFADGSKPYLLKPGERIESKMIVNVLFSTEAEVEKLWPGEVSDDVRPLFGYRMKDVVWDSRDSAA